MSQIINILHLSDVHFSKKNEYNQKVVHGALMSDISALAEGSLKPDIVVISGDLVNNADEVLNDGKTGIYYQFFDDFIEPLVQATKCNYTRIITTPGNHDVHRSYIEKNFELNSSLVERLTTRDALNKEYTEDESNLIIKDKFKEYHDLRYGFLSGPHVVFDNKFVSVSRFDDLKLNIIEANSAWLGLAHVNKAKDDRKLAIAEAAIGEGLSHLSRGYATIFVTHHPRNFLAEFCEDDINQVLDGKVDLHLYGHMHNPLPQSVGSYKGNCFFNQSGALNNKRDQYIGYSLIRLDVETKHMEIRLRSYQDPRREFDIANSRVIGGVYHPTAESRHFFNNKPTINTSTVKKWAEETLRPFLLKDFNEGLTDRPVCELFVAPPLVAEEKLQHENDNNESKIEIDHVSFSFEDIVNSNSNYFIYGKSEYGKTTLLRQIALTLLSNDQLLQKINIPAVINFRDISQGHDPIKKLIRPTLPDIPDGIKLDYLLEEGMLTICIDDVVFEDLARYSLLTSFIKKFPRNRFIFSTLVGRNANYMAVSDIAMPVSFRRVFIQSLRRSDMRSLIAKWDKNKQIDRESVLNRLMGELKNINVPFTAVNGTILLSIFETKANFSPVNRAVLIERFIESLLDKSSMDEIARKHFDYRIRTHYLSHVASTMTYTNNYVLEENELQNITDHYIQTLGLPENSRSLIDICISARIFQQRLDRKIQFRYRAFLEYFIAIQMTENKEFRDFVLSEENYLSFVNEISYYASIGRQDVNLLEMVSERFSVFDQELFTPSIGKTELASLDTFRFPRVDASSDDLVNDVIRQINAPPMTDAERDEILEADLPKDVEGRQEVFRPKPVEIGSKWFTCLIIYSNVVRNLELIPDALKRQHLSAVLHAWSKLLMASLWGVPQLAKHRQAKINGVMYEVIAPKNFTEAQVARSLYTEFPNAVSKMVFSSVGTEKLENQLKQPCLTEAAEPKIVRFFRESLYLDLQLHDWWTRFNSMVSEFKSSRYLTTVTLAKAKEIHALGVMSEPVRKNLRITMADMVASLRGVRGNQRSEMMSKQIQKFEKVTVLNKIMAKHQNL